TLTAGTGRLDEHARDLGRAVLASEMAQHEAACQVLGAAVWSVVCAALCARHHRGLGSAWAIGEITSAVTSVLVDYALKTPRRDGHLDVTCFADGVTSASGWIGKVIGSMRPTRILREMHADASLFADPDTLAQTPTPSAEEQLLGVRAPDVQGDTKGMPATSAAVRLVHASALRALLGLPPRRAWDLTPAQRRELRAAVDVDPQLPARVPAGGASDADAPV